MLTEYRNEWKFLCTEYDIERTRMRILPLMREDEHQESPDGYNVRSIYFDDWDNSCFWDNAGGIDQRRKYRLRIYNSDDSFIQLEMKYKSNDMIHKEGTQVTRDLFDKIMDGMMSFQDAETALLRRFWTDMRNTGLHPVVIAEYERIAYTYPAGNVRVTFDRNISASEDYTGFFNAELSRIPVLDSGKHIMEVKFDGVLPNMIRNALDTGRLSRTSFSKYYLCRERIQ